MSPHCKCVPDLDIAGDGTCDLCRSLKVTSCKNCARCGGEHEGLQFKAFEQPFQPKEAVDRYGKQIVWSAWATCPVTGDPILQALWYPHG